MACPQELPSGWFPRGTWLHSISHARLTKQENKCACVFSLHPPKSFVSTGGLTASLRLVWIWIDWRTPNKWAAARQRKESQGSLPSESEVSGQVGSARAVWCTAGSKAFGFSSAQNAQITPKPFRQNEETPGTVLPPPKKKSWAKKKPFRVKMGYAGGLRPSACG